MLRGLRLAKVEKVAELLIVTSASIFKPTHSILAGDDENDGSRSNGLRLRTPRVRGIRGNAQVHASEHFEQQEEAYTQTYTSDRHRKNS